MPRELKLYRVDIWNRATIADGSKLQATTIRSLSANDVILANAVDSYSKELHDYYYSEYDDVVDKINPDITKWNASHKTVKDNSANWCSVYGTVETNKGKWNSTYNTVKANSAKWNAAYGSARSGAAASAWLHNGGLPSNDHITDFNVIRPGGEFSNHYQRYGTRDGVDQWYVGPDTMTVTNTSAYDGENHDKTIILQIGPHTVPGGRNFAFLPQYTSGINGEYNLATINYNGTLADVNKTIVVGCSGILNQGRNSNSNCSLLFIKGGCYNFTNSMGTSVYASFNVNDSYFRGGNVSDAHNSIGISYDDQAGANGGDISKLYNSIANVKGTELGIHNSLSLKGNTWSYKGREGAASFMHNGFGVGFYNSYTTNCEHRTWMADSAIYNSVVSNYYGYTNTAYNGSSMNASISTIHGNYQCKPGSKNCVLYYSAFSWTTPPVEDSYGTFYRTANTIGQISASIIKVNDAAIYDNSQFNNIYIQANNCQIGYNTYFEHAIINNVSSLGTGDTGSWKNSIINNYHDIGHYSNGLNTISNSLIWKAVKTRVNGYQGKYDINNCLLCLDTKEYIQYPYYNNSFVRAVYDKLDKGSTAPTNGNEPVRNCYFSIETGVSAHLCIPGNGPSSKTGGFIFNEATSATRNIRYTDDESPLFSFTKSSRIDGSYYNVLYFGQKIVAKDINRAQPEGQMIFGKNIKFGGGSKDAHNKYFVFGQDIEADSTITESKCFIFGKNMSSNNEDYLKLINKLDSTTSQARELNDKFILCSEDGPYFIVTSIGHDTENNRNGIYFLKKDKKWYDVVSNTAL